MKLSERGVVICTKTIKSKNAMFFFDSSRALKNTIDLDIITDLLVSHHNFLLFKKGNTYRYECKNLSLNGITGKRIIIKAEKNVYFPIKESVFSMIFRFFS